MHNCTICGQCFTRKYSLGRHIDRKHSSKHELQGSWSQDQQATKGSLSQDQQVGVGDAAEINSEMNKPNFVFKHPFSMIVAAPSGGGKTYLVKQLLENRSKSIQPSPQRIIWLYAQWQPLYEELQHIIPGIEFVKGIPWNIEENSFLNPKIRNLIVMDDLMTQATKDGRISDLFTKGSHHRNLSVICLLQNLYYHGKENRTMSLNSHYIVLFKNPRDEQQVMTLARQMCPGNSQ